MSPTVEYIHRGTRCTYSGYIQCAQTCEVTCTVYSLACKIEVPGALPRALVRSHLHTMCVQLCTHAFRGLCDRAHGLNLIRRKRLSFGS